MMHQSFISILSTLIILSSGLPSFVSALRFTHTQALAPTSPPPNPSPLDIPVPPIPPTSNYASNLSTWPAPPIRYYVRDTCFLDITAFSIPSSPVPILDVFSSIVSIRNEINELCDSHKAFLPIFDHGPVTIDFTTPISTQMFCSVAISILDTLGELFHHWGIVELKTVQLSTLQGINFGSFSVEIRTDGISRRDVSTTTHKSPPTLSQQSNLTAWPPSPIISPISPSTTIQINDISIPAGMPPAGAMFTALNGFKTNLDRYFRSPQTILPPVYFSVVTVSAWTEILVVFAAGEGSCYTWGLARSVLAAVAAMEHEYGSAQLGEVVVHESGEGDRIFRLEKYDRGSNAGKIILPRTLPSNSGPSLSLSPSRAIPSADLREWPDPPIVIDLMPGHVTLTILRLTPIQGYPTMGADIGAMIDVILYGGTPLDPFPRSVSLRQGRLTTRFFVMNLTRGIIVAVLLQVRLYESIHGAAELQRAALVINGFDGGFTLRVDDADGLDEETQSTNTSRRSLPSSNKEFVISSLDSLSQNLTVDKPSANLTAWPTPPIFLRIDPIHLFMNITAISPAEPPYVPILASIQGIILELESAEEPPSALLPYIVLTQYFGRVAVTWTSLPPRIITYGMALQVMETVLELELGHGIQQVMNADIKVQWQIWGHFSLVISDHDHPLSPAPTLTQEGNGVMMKTKKKRDVRAWPRPPIFRTISRTIAIDIKAISPGVPPYDTIINDIIALRTQINSIGPPETLLGIHTYLVTGSVEIVFTDSVLRSLTVGVAVAVMDEVLELEIENGPQQLDEVEVLVNRRFQGHFWLEFIEPGRAGANMTIPAGGIEVGSQITD